MTRRIVDNSSASDGLSMSAGEAWQKAQEEAVKAWEAQGAREGAVWVKAHKEFDQLQERLQELNEHERQALLDTWFDGWKQALQIDELRPSMRLFCREFMESPNLYNASELVACLAFDSSQSERLQILNGVMKRVIPSKR